MENDAEIDLIAIAKKLWTCRKKIVIFGVFGLILGIIVAISTPKEYACAVKFAPESSDNSSAMSSFGGFASMMGLGGSAGGTSGVNEKIYPDILKSSPFLSQFYSMEVETEGQTITLARYLAKEQKRAWWSHIMGLPSTLIGAIRGADSDSVQSNIGVNSKYMPNAKESSFESALSSRISLEQDSKSSLIEITVKMQDPLIAAIVADSVMLKLNRFMVAYKTNKAKQDLEASEVMFTEAKEKYEEAEYAYAEAQDRNRNLIKHSALVKVEKLSNERNLAFNLYQQLASQVEMSRLKLQDETPIATIIVPPVAPISPSGMSSKVIAIAFAFLFSFGCCGWIVLKELIGRSE